MLPMQAVVRSWDAFYPTLAIFFIGLIGMYFLWYRHLPKVNYFEPGEEAGVKQQYE
jgi:hypothetical protein